MICDICKNKIEAEEEFYFAPNIYDVNKDFKEQIKNPLYIHHAKCVKYVLSTQYGSIPEFENGENKN